jgi:hypothetical protein
MLEAHAMEENNHYILESDLHELAKDYSQYLEVDSSKEVRLRC